jgi:hypothetical protein
MTNEEEIIEKLEYMCSKEELEHMCSKYARDIENLKGDGDIEEFFNNDVLETRYVVDGYKNYIGAELCVAYGGPTVWINTIDQQIKGYWGYTTVYKHFRGDVLDDYLCENWKNKDMN